MTISEREALWQLLERRRDQRHFKLDAPSATIERLLKVFVVAPSAGLSQSWAVTVVTTPELKESVYQGFLQVRRREEQRFEGARRSLYDTLKVDWR